MMILVVADDLRRAFDACLQGEKSYIDKVVHGTVCVYCMCGVGYIAIAIAMLRFVSNR